MDQNYIEYKFPSSLSSWKDDLFYIKNHKPPLLERSNATPKVQVEWNRDPNAVDLYQVLELVDWIKALRAEGVTGASVIVTPDL
jgi:hypothetical protein